MVELGSFSELGILASENLVSKISKEPLELGSGLGSSVGCTSNW